MGQKNSIAREQISEAMEKNKSILSIYNTSRDPFFLK